MITPGTFNRDEALRDFFFAYRYEDESMAQFIAKKVVPIMDIPKDNSGSADPPRTFKLTTLNDAPFRVPNANTGPYGRVEQVDIDHRQDLFEVVDKYLEAIIEGIIAGQATFDLEKAKAQFIAENLDLVHEKDLSSVIMNAANYATGYKEVLSGADQWTNAASNPIAKLKAAIRTVLRWPNKMVFGVEAWDSFSTNDLVLKTFGIYGGVGGNVGQAVDEASVARYFGVKEIHIGRARYNVAAGPGIAEDLEFIWPDSVAILHEPDNPTTETLTHTLVLSGEKADVMKWDEMYPGPKGSRFIRAGWNRVIIVKSNRMGYLIEDTNAA